MWCCRKRPCFTDNKTNNLISDSCFVFPSTQGGSSGPGGGRPAGSAALLSLPGSMSTELRTERRPSWAPAPRGPALWRLRLLATCQRDLTSAAEGPQYGEKTHTPYVHTAVYHQTTTDFKMLWIEFSSLWNLDRRLKIICTVCSKDIIIFEVNKSA